MQVERKNLFFRSERVSKHRIFPFSSAQIFTLVNKILNKFLKVYFNSILLKDKSV